METRKQIAFSLSSRRNAATKQNFEMMAERTCDVKANGFT